MKAFRSQPVGDGYLVVARFEQPVRAANVVRELGRLSVWPAVGGAGGLVVDDGSGPDVPLEERDVPPDVVLVPTGPLVEHHVTGRAPVVVEPVDAVGPFDERVFNPIGFEAVVDGPVVDAGTRCERPADPVRGAGPVAAVVGRRAARRVAAPTARALVAAVVDGRRAGRGPDSEVDLSDPVAREEHSVVLRRAAHAAYSTAAWRRGRPTGPAYAWRPSPSVSVVLATRRPEMLAFALRQVRQQRGVDLQLVLAPHGFEPDPDVRARARPGRARGPPAADGPCCSATC